MINSFDKKDGQREDVREIPKWTRRYAQSRTLPFLVSLVVFVLLFAANGISALLVGRAFQSGNMLAVGISIGALVVALTATAFFSIPKWGGKLIIRIAGRLYRSEGYATLSPPSPIHKHPWPVKVAGFLFGACILTSVALGVLGYIPIKYMQPVSALYCVPFLVFLGFWFRPMAGPGPFGLIWPLLYALHAILVVAGAPIQFTGGWESLNMLIPVAGYGLLCGLIGHIYNRFALSKLKRLASVKQADSAKEIEINQ